MYENTTQHDDVVAEVMTELAEDYWPGIRWAEDARLFDLIGTRR